MPRFYQHLEPGDKLGKVTRLKYVDDISDDELVLYYFEDGTKCSSDFIGEVEEVEPMKVNRVMITLAGPNFQWKIKQVNIKTEDSDFMVGDDGVRYQSPSPDMILAGGPGSQNRSVSGKKREGVRIETHPPRIPAKYTLPPIEDYLLSLHPELETGASVVESTPAVVSKPKAFSASQRMIREIDETAPASVSVKTPVEDFDEELAKTEAKSAQTTVTVKKKPKNLSVDVDALVSNPNYTKITMKIDGKTVEIPTEDFKERLLNKPSTAQTNAAVEQIKANEDVLIKNMIDKSKKKACKITMGITLELPPKEVYDTIKDVYEEGMAEQFVSSLTARISQENLLQSLSSGLAQYYEKSDKKTV